MNNSERVIWNSIVLYAKILICIVLSLWTVPIILHGLGESDYGLYTLVAGVISMLAFLKTSMTSSTQRYLSVAYGSRDARKMNEVFNSALMLHLLFGIVLVLGLEALSPFLFDHFLNILPERIHAGKVIYQTLIASMFITIMMVPFDAELNAYENMPVFAVIEISDAVLKLILAFSIQYATWDRLIWYGMGLAIIPAIDLAVKYLYTRYQYKELYICRSLLWNPPVFREMFNFTMWNTFGAVTVLGRNEGIAVILNLFFGTIINAAYGIANQINSVMSYFSQTLLKSILPQLMQSEGMGNRTRMIRLVFTASKFCVLVMGVIAVPLIVELPYVLKLWLTNVPNHTIEFTRLILVVSIIYQMSSGLMAGILSVGKVKVYQMVISTIILMNLPIAYILLKMGYEPYWIFVGMTGCEIVGLATRLGFAKNIFDLPVGHFCLRVILPLMVIIGVDWLINYGVICIMETSFVRMILNCALSIIWVGISSWMVLLNETEKKAMLQFTKSTILRFKR